MQLNLKNKAMRVINIIESTIDSPILSIESFGIKDEKLKDKVVEKAESLFKAKAIENGANAGEIDVDIENGYYARRDGYTVSIVWSSI